MQPAILDILYFSTPASIIPLTLLHTELKLAIDPVDMEGMGCISNEKKKKEKKGVGKRHFHVRGVGTFISAASLHALDKVFLSPSLLNIGNFYHSMV